MYRIFCSILILNFCIAFLRAEEVIKKDIHEYHLNESNVGVKEEETVTWNEFMIKATRATHQLIDNFQPTLNRTLTSGNLSMPCVKSLQLYFDGIKTWEPWAIKMFDATGKIPSGLLTGTMMDYGSFDQCLQVRARTKGISEPFKGKYCMVTVKSPLVRPMDTKTSSNKSYVEEHGNPPDWITEYMQVRKNGLAHSSICLGTCFPSTCSEKDIYNFVSTALKPWPSKIELYNCQDDTPRSWSPLHLTAILSIATLFGICILGTILDFIDHRQQHKLEKEITSANKGVWRSIFKAFSLTTNSAKLFEKRVRKSPLDSLDGIRFFLAIYIVAAHVVGFMEHLREQKLSFSNYTFYMFGYTTIFLENGFLVVEFFFVISGFILFKTTMRTLKNGGKINFIEFTIKRYFRWMPSVIFLIMTGIAVSVVSNGPLWDSTWNILMNKCEKSWWTNAIFVQNFVDDDYICLQHTWFLASLFQIEIVGLVLLLLISRFRKTGIVMVLVMVTVCISVDFITSLTYELPMFRVGVVPKEVGNKFVFYLYNRPFNHFCSFVNGMVLGWSFDTYKDTKLSKRFYATCWVVSITCLLICFYFLLIPTTNLKITSAYYALRNVFCSLVYCWICFSLFTGHGGFVNRFLSSQFFVPLGRISYCIYIFHPVVLLFRGASRRERLFMGVEELIFDSVPIFVLSIILAFIVHITVELPFNSIYDIIYEKFFAKKTSKKTIPSRNEMEIQNGKHKSN